MPDSDNGTKSLGARHDAEYHRDYRRRIRRGLPSLAEETQLEAQERRDAAVARVETIRRDIEVRQFPLELKKAVDAATKALNRSAIQLHRASNARSTTRRAIMKPIEDCQQAVRTGCVGLKDQAPISDELVWIGCNAHLDDPDFSTCPSLLAANQWVEIRTDPHLKRAFWQMLWAYRQGKIGQAPSPMSEDIEKVAETKEETEDEVDIAALERRLDRKLGVEGPGDANG